MSASLPPSPRRVGRLVRAIAGSHRRRTITALVTGIVTALAVAGGPAFAVFSTTASSSTTTVTTSTFACFTRSPAQSPTLFWAYNEATGTTATDSSGNGRTGTPSGSVTRTSGTCTDTPAITLTATSGSVVSPSLTAPPTDLTLETWFKTTASGTTGGGRMIGYGSSASGSSTTYDRALYMDNAGHVCFEMNFGNPASICTGSTYNNGAWHLVDASVVGGSAQGARVLYIDGVSQTTGVSGRTSSSYAGYWRVGTDAVADLQTAGNSLGSANAGPTNTGWPGSLDNTAVYGSILTQAQVTAHYNASVNAR